MNLLSENEQYRVHLGDCIPHMMADMPAESVDFSVFRHLFQLFMLTQARPKTLETVRECVAKQRYIFRFYRALARVMKPGRAVVVHVMQIPRLKRSGEVGLHDYRGINIRLGERAGLVYEYDWCVRKNPQAQAIRTRSRELQFAGLESDALNSEGLCRIT